MSRNITRRAVLKGRKVTPRERRVSRNYGYVDRFNVKAVTPRERRVSRNNTQGRRMHKWDGHASREACE